jgi:hypothetical protein
MELRLDDEPQVDLAVEVRDPDQVNQLPPEVLQPTAQAVLERWAENDVSLRSVHSFWLEYDLDERPAHDSAGSSRAPRPSCLLIAKLREPMPAEWLTGDLLPAMIGDRLDSTERELVEAAVAAIPGSGRLLYVFAAHRPSLARLRLELSGLSPSRMHEYLLRIAPAAAPAVLGVDGIVGEADRFHLSFDIGRSIEPRIGVEASFSRLPHREPGWERLFDRLVLSGACSAAKREALLAWPGVETSRSAGKLWPRIGDQPVPGHLACCLSHVKLVCRPGAVPDAKAYVVLKHLPGPDQGPIIEP